MNSRNIRKNLRVFAGAFLCCFLWGSAFPGIKIGYRLWNIPAQDTWSIIRFAGIRFFLAGLLVLLMAGCIRKKLLIPKKEEWPLIILLSLFQTIGQYFFFYLGLAHTTGVNSAVVDSLTAFFAILIAGVFMRMETLNFRKIFGCILGFSGVLLINITSEGFSISPLGDGLIALSAFCYGISSALIKKYSVQHDTVLFSGYQFAFGGLVMAVAGQAGVFFGGAGQSAAPGPGLTFNAAAVMILIYLALVSSVAYTLWGILLKSNEVSKISVFGFMNPVIGVILSALLLGEFSSLGIRYVFALLLVSAGIITVNSGKHKKFLI